VVNLNKVDVELLEQVVGVVVAVVLVVEDGTTFRMVNTMTEWEVQTIRTRSMSGKAVTLVGVVLPRGELSISNGGEKTEEEEKDKIKGEETDKIIKSKICGSSCKVGRELW